MNKWWLYVYREREREMSPCSKTHGPLRMLRLPHQTRQAKLTHNWTTRKWTNLEAPAPYMNSSAGFPRLAMSLQPFRSWHIMTMLYHLPKDLGILPYTSIRTVHCSWKCYTSPGRKSSECVSRAEAYPTGSQREPDGAGAPINSGPFGDQHRSCRLFLKFSMPCSLSCSDRSLEKQQVNSHGEGLKFCGRGQVGRFATSDSGAGSQVAMSVPTCRKILFLWHLWQNSSLQIMESYRIIESHKD